MGIALNLPGRPSSQVRPALKPFSMYLTIRPTIKDRSHKTRSENPTRVKTMNARAIVYVGVVGRLSVRR
jgi:hypothetical protein